LTGVTDPAERKVKPGYENKAPRTPEDRERAYRESEIYKSVRKDIADLKEQFKQDDAEGELKQAVKQQRSGGSSVYNRSLWQMTKALTKRQVLIKKGDMGALYVKSATNVV
jgi:ATP-binding cassette subfamily G (WHITE) protein 2 (SNQ2)